ncbi:MAG: hypothetical protein HY819_24905 [Acidobacteria bacterium]|nr:hypothetical protein [Acidobacteriota bacterium]
MSRKQSVDKKKFFGDHLEIKPVFMQRPKSMEEVMAETFSKPSTVENNATVENKTPTDIHATVELQATVENLSVENNATVENKTPTDIHATVELQATVENLSVENNATVEKKAIVNSKTLKNQAKDNNINTLPEIEKPELEFPATAVKTTVVKTTVANNSTVAIQIPLEEVPGRLRADVSLLRRVITIKWQTFPEIENLASDSPTYWQAYTKAWHWIEDEVVPYLDKDSKLTLRRCYRKAFGDITAKGKFFAGQTSLAQEVGLSKRRIQDILEIFNLLGWVKKIAHHNRGGYKGTDYEMCLPSKAIECFLENE